MLEAREDLGLDQQEVSRRSGISRVMVSEYERGGRTMSLDHLHRIANALQVRPGWLIEGVGEKWVDGPTRGQIRDEAMAYRRMDVDFVAAVNAMLRRYRQDKKRRTWALGACLRAYWGAHWLGFEDLREVAQIIEVACERCDLELVEVLESTGHANAAQYVADWLMHRGIDPEALGPVVQTDGTSYEVQYHPELAREPHVLHRLSEERTPRESKQGKTKANETLDYLMGFIRIFDPQTKRK